MIDSRGQVHDLDNVIAGGQRLSEQSADFTSNDYFHVALQVKVGNSCRAIGHELLADKCMISPEPEVAHRTLERTTQRGVRTISHPSLSRRFRTNNRQLCYKRLRHDLFTDTMQSKYKSRRGELYSQARLVIPAGILRIPVFSFPVALFSQES